MESKYAQPYPYPMHSHPSGPPIPSPTRAASLLHPTLRRTRPFQPCKFELRERSSIFQARTEKRIGPKSTPHGRKAPRKRRQRKENAGIRETGKMTLPPLKARSPRTARQHTESAVRARKNSDQKIPDLPPAPTYPEVLGSSIV